MSAAAKLSAAFRVAVDGEGRRGAWWRVAGRLLILLEREGGEAAGVLILFFPPRKVAVKNKASFAHLASEKSKT